MMGAQEQGADATTGRWLALVRTLCFVRHGSDVLLLKRSADRRVFPGLYNGLGGHLERGEDPYSGALREIREESGLMVQALHLRGISTIDAGAETGILLFVFTAESLTRTVTDSEEGTLHWVPITEAHKLPLVEDVPILLSRVFGSIAAAPFFAQVRYDASDRIVMKFAEEM